MAETCSSQIKVIEVPQQCAVGGAHQGVSDGRNIIEMQLNSPRGVIIRGLASQPVPKQFHFLCFSYRKAKTGVGMKPGVAFFAETVSSLRINAEPPLNVFELV